MLTDKTGIDDLPLKPAGRFSFGSQSRILVGISIIVAILSCIYSFSSYRSAVAEQRRSADLLNRTLEEPIAQTFNVVRLVLSGLSERIKESGYRSSRLSDFRAGLPFIRSLSIVGVDGIVLDSTYKPNVGVAFPRKDFLPPLDVSGPALRIGVSSRGRDLVEMANPPSDDGPNNGLSFIPVTLPITTPQGQQLLVASLNPDFFFNQFDKHIDSNDRVIEVLRRDGVVLLNTDPRGVSGGLQPGPALLDALRTIPSGAMDSQDILGNNSLGAFRVVPYFPLVVMNYVRKEQVWIKWTEQQLPVILLVSGSALLVLLLAGIHLQTRSQQTAERQRTDHREQNRLTALLDALPAAIVMLDRDNHIFRFNDAWIKLVSEPEFGLPDGGVGQHYVDVFKRLSAPSNDLAEKSLDVGIQSVSNNRQLRFDHEFLTARSSGFPWFRVYVRPIQTPDSHDLLLMLLNVTEFKNLEEIRERSNILLQDSMRELAFEKKALDTHAIISLTDANGVITYVNDKFVEASGFRADEIVGQTHRLIKSDVHSAAFFGEMWATIKRGETWHGELASRRKDGTIFWTTSTLMPKMNKQGVAAQFIAIRTDITAQKQAELAVTEAHHREIQTGREIQKALLQGEFPAHFSGGHGATHTEPSQTVDGDFFSYMQYSPQCFDVLVGDVMGKGIHAALIGAAIKAAFSNVVTMLLTQHTGTNQLPPPGDIMNALNRQIVHQLIDLESYATVALYRVNLSDISLTYVNAGHTPALLCERSSGALLELLGHNLPIGVLSDEVYVESRIMMQEGDGLLLYSDGITDARNDEDEEFGTERLKDAVSVAWSAEVPPAMVLQYLRLKGLRFADPLKQCDDQTMVMFELDRSFRDASKQTEIAISVADKTCPLVFPWTLDMLDAFRAFVEEYAACSTEEETQQMTLACCEAVTNIIRHATPMVTDAKIVCRATQSIDRSTLEFFYLGKLFVADNVPDPDFSGEAEGGFGLFIIRSLVDEFDSFDPLPDVVCTRLVKRYGSTDVKLDD